MDFRCEKNWDGTHCDQLSEDAKGYDSTAIIAGSVVGVFLVCLTTAMIIVLVSRFVSHV